MQFGNDIKSFVMTSAKRESSTTSREAIRDAAENKTIAKTTATTITTRLLPVRIASKQDESFGCRVNDRTARRRVNENTLPRMMKL
jgi:hypothetical protein